MHWLEWTECASFFLCFVTLIPFLVINVLLVVKDLVRKSQLLINLNFPRSTTLVNMTTSYRYVVVSTRGLYVFVCWEGLSTMAHLWLGWFGYMSSSIHSGGYLAVNCWFGFGHLNFLTIFRYQCSPGGQDICRLSMKRILYWSLSFVVSFSQW